MKVSNENLVLHLPFDEEAGSAVAHNFAPNRTNANDAILTGDCSFNEDEGYLRLNESGEVSVNANLLNYNGEFTTTAFIRAKGGQISFLMTYQGNNLHHTHSVSTSPNSWYFCAIERVIVGNTYYARFLLDEQVVLNEPCLGIPSGISINVSDDEPTADVDDLKLWNRALTLSELFALSRADGDVEYLVDGVNFKTFGVEVSQANGLMDALERKEPLRVDWDSVHGEVIDLSRPHWQRRELTLECFITASSNYAFVRAMKRFMSAFEKAGTQRLTCQYQGSVKPLEFDVYRNDKVEVDKTWNEDLMVGTFTLALIEPEPVKMVLKHIAHEGNYTAAISLQTDRKLTITWGDGTTNCIITAGTGNAYKSANLSGKPLSVRHTYATAGDYDIVIHGNIEDILHFDSNCITLWSK